LICNGLCFDKTENDRFGPNSGGVFLTQKTLILIYEFEYIICRKSQVVQHHLIETDSSYHRGSKETSTMVEE